MNLISTEAMILLVGMVSFILGFFIRELIEAIPTRDRLVYLPVQDPYDKAVIQQQRTKGRMRIIRDETNDRRT